MTTDQAPFNSSKLRIFREMHNFTVKHLATEVLDISVAAYRKLELQPTKLTREQADKLAALYHITVPELLATDSPIVSFNNNTIDKAYIHNLYEFEKEVLEKVIASRNAEIEHLRKECAQWQAQSQQLLVLLERKLS